MFDIRKYKWNVYEYNWNTKEIEVFNIFEHYGFAEDIIKLRKDFRKGKVEIKDIEEKVRGILFYRFCSKCEYEVLISNWVGVKNETNRKVDIYEQVWINKDRFINYIVNEVFK